MITSSDNLQIDVKATKQRHFICNMAADGGVCAFVSAGSTRLTGDTDHHTDDLLIRNSRDLLLLFLSFLLRAIVLSFMRMK